MIAKNSCFSGWGAVSFLCVHGHWYLEHTETRKRKRYRTARQNKERKKTKEEGGKGKRRKAKKKKLEIKEKVIILSFSFTLAEYCTLRSPLRSSGVSSRASFLLLHLRGCFAVAPLPLLSPFAKWCCRRGLLCGVRRRKSTKTPSRYSAQLCRPSKNSVYKTKTNKTIIIPKIKREQT